MKPRYMLGIFIIAVTFILGLAACGGGSGGSSDTLSGGAASVNFSVQLAGASGAPNTLKNMEGEDDDHDSPECTDDAGTVIALSEVRANIREVEFFLPDGVRCEDVQFTFIDPVRCVTDDDDDEQGDDDDQGEDENGDDDIKAMEGSDDGDVADDVDGDLDDNDDGDQDDVGEDDQGDDDQGEDDGDDDGDKVVIDGPFIVDMIAGTSTPSLTNFLIPAGLYTRIDIRLHKTEDGETLPADDPLNGHSLVATGEFEFEGVPHTLHIRLKFDEEIRFRDPAGIDVAETGANDVVVNLDETTWFQGIDLVGCLEDGDLVFADDGSLTIDEDHSGDGDCGDIENIIRDNIEASGNIVKDHDDGDDDDDEMDDDDGDEPDGDDDDGTPDQGPGDL